MKCSIKCIELIFCLYIIIEDDFPVQIMPGYKNIKILILFYIYTCALILNISPLKKKKKNEYKIVPLFHYPYDYWKC